MLKTVYTDMVGDLFHAGHINYLRQIRRLISKEFKAEVFLIVGLHSDEAVLKVKGRLPICTLAERVEVLQYCSLVDLVVPNVPFEITERMLDTHRWDFVAHSDQLTSFHKNVNYKVPIERGIMKTVPHTEGISTTDLIARIKQREK